MIPGMHGWPVGDGPQHGMARLDGAANHRGVRHESGCGKNAPAVGHWSTARVQQVVNPTHTWHTPNGLLNRADLLASVQLATQHDDAGLRIDVDPTLWDLRVSEQFTLHTLR